MFEGHIFTFFDTETTGLSPQSGDAIIELAAIKMQNGTVLEKEIFESFVNPQRPIPYESTAVNKITDDMVATAPTIGDILPGFLDFVEGTTMVAHNAEFDLAFLDEALFATNPFAQLPTTICTKVLSRKITPKEKFHNLDTLSYRYNIPLPGESRHRALADVELLAKVFLKLIEDGKITSLEALYELSKVR